MTDSIQPCKSNQKKLLIRQLQPSKSLRYTVVCLSDYANHVLLQTINENLLLCVLG